MTMNKNNDYWSDYWLNDGQSGEVFVDQRGEKPNYIRNFWIEALKTIKAGSEVLDIACGAGSIYEDLSYEQRANLTLHAADLSEAALDILTTRLPAVETSVCAAQDTPFDDARFNVLVSQFGIEYAGFDAFSEAMRILAPGGSFVFLCHMADGYIDQRNQAFLVGASTALTSGFIPAAKDLIKASFDPSSYDLAEAKRDFQTAQQPLADMFEEYPSGIHHHLYFGFREMYLKYGNYHQADIIGWIDQMELDIRKSIEKVNQIRKVSLDHSQVKIVEQRLNAGGLDFLNIEQFKVPDRPDDVVAWHISGRKKAI